MNAQGTSDVEEGERMRGAATAGPKPRTRGLGEERRDAEASLAGSDTWAMVGAGPTTTAVS
ncbi:hypothetical protein EF916_18590 [Streptomyces sp. WAC08452]|nr:hypothetical protein EF916_18590 [Streptomyces sp. WAC08452]